MDKSLKDQLWDDFVKADDEFWVTAHALQEVVPELWQRHSVAASRRTTAKHLWDEWASGKPVK